MDANVLTYNDVVLRTSDLQSLEDGNYLNDTVLDFYFACLSTHYKSDEFLPIPTSISFLLANTLDFDTFISTIESLNLTGKKLIFFTVNDNSNFSSSDGGSHWSLLVYCRRRNLFMHYDSCVAMNYEAAFTIYETMNNYDDFESAEFVECRAPRQRNGFDCGLYAMEIATAICAFYFEVDRFRSREEISGTFDVMWSVDRDYVESEKRSQLLELISVLKEEETNPK